MQDYLFKTTFTITVKSLMANLHFKVEVTLVVACCCDYMGKSGKIKVWPICWSLVNKILSM